MNNLLKKVSLLCFLTNQFIILVQGVAKNNQCFHEKQMIRRGC